MAYDGLMVIPVKVDGTKELSRPGMEIAAIAFYIALQRWRKDLVCRGDPVDDSRFKRLRIVRPGRAHPFGYLCPNRG